MKENQPVEVETIDKYLKYTFSDFKKKKKSLENKDCSPSIGPLYKDDFYYLCTILILKEEKNKY